MFNYLPQPPWEGPPLPRALKQRWPWCETKAAVETETLAESETTTCKYCNPKVQQVVDDYQLDKEILLLHKERVPAIEIAARLNVAPDLVRYRLRRVGLEPLPAPMFLKAERLRQDIIKLHEQGYSAREISEKLNIDWSYVLRRLREAELEPRPSPEKKRRALAKAGEIISLFEQDVPRYKIARRTGTSWPLVADILTRAEIKPVTPASAEIASWASELLPLVENIRKTEPDTEPSLEKVDKLAEELTAIREAGYVEERRLPRRGIEAEKERWRLGFISRNANEALGLMDALRGCIRSLDTETLLKKLEQANVCIENISNTMREALAEAAGR